MDGKGARSDRVIAGIAARQHGVVSIGQLRGAGVSDDAVRRRVRAGRLHRIYRGVYAVGHTGLSREGGWMAAVLACGGRMEDRGVRDREGERDGRSLWNEWRDTGTRADGWKVTDSRRLVALSHRNAAALWGLLPPQSGPIDISVTGYGGRKGHKGIRLHRSMTLAPATITRHRGIPVTTPARTIADLRRAAPPESSHRAGPARGGQGAISSKQLRRAIRQAEVLGLSIGAEAPPDRTRSELEGIFLKLCRRHGLPAPEVNVWIGSFEVDFLWRDRRLIVETDGYRYHRGRVAFEDDRDRDLELRGLGYEVVRLTYRQVVEDPERVARVLRGMLAAQNRR